MEIYLQKYVKRAEVLIATALVCATYLSIALTNLGLDKFHYILAGGKKFATFPDLASQIGIGLSYLILAVLYLIWFFTVRVPAFPYFADALRSAIVFLALAFIAYPLGNDVYLYLHAGLMNLSEVNPFLVRAGNFTSELSAFVDWGQTSTYGPVSQLLFTLSAAVLTFDPILAVYTFKAFCLILHILNGYLIWQLLPPFERNKITIAYLVNPLLLMEQVGSAHVDVLVSTSLIVLAASLARQRYWVAFVALWGGFLAKTIPLIWVPLAAVFLVRQQRWKLLVQLILASLGVVALLSLKALPGVLAWQSLLNPGVSGQYQSSLHALVKFGLDLVRIFFPGTLDLAQTQSFLFGLTRLTLLGFAGFYGWIAWQGYRRSIYIEPDLVEDIGWVTLVLLLVATPWLMPWYASSVLTIAALIPRARLFGLTSLAFGLSSSAQYLLQGHSSLKSLIAIAIPVTAFLTGWMLLKGRLQQGLDSTTQTAIVHVGQPVITDSKRP